MPIRKHGAVTGEVTGVDQQESPQVMQRDAALNAGWDEQHAWDGSDDQDLADENQAADG